MMFIMDKLRILNLITMVIIPLIATLFGIYGIIQVSGLSGLFQINRWETIQTFFTESPVIAWSSFVTIIASLCFRVLYVYISEK